MKVYCLDQDQAYNIASLKELIDQSGSVSLHFVWPPALIYAVGPAYWIESEKILRNHDLTKKLFFWYDYSDFAGYVLGALRAGVKCLIYQGEEVVFQKLEECASQMDAFLVRSIDEIPKIQRDMQIHVFND